MSLADRRRKAGKRGSRKGEIRARKETRAKKKPSPEKREAPSCETLSWISEKAKRENEKRKQEKSQRVAPDHNQTPTRREREPPSSSRSVIPSPPPLPSVSCTANTMFSTDNFDAKSLPFSLEGKRWISVEQQSRLGNLLLPYIAANAVDNLASFRAHVLPSKNTLENVDESSKVFSRIMLQVGNGTTKFRSFDGEELTVVAQSVGKPVGGGCGVDWMKNLIVFTEGPIEKLASFLSQLVERSEKSEEGKFTCYTWNIEHSYWREETKIKSRPLQSVVLPIALKTRLVNDLEKFLSPRTKDFYTRNGIPYRRSYLFYGVPGTGKTSLVQALAGHFHRSVSFLLPTHPKMTDDSLREAINQIPDETIVVFEDIDSLFTSDRANRVAGSSLTFSGLLNALDGISNPNGQVFVLTTNLRDNLDHALIRNGRVDMHVEFGYAVAEQMEMMWTNFYPDASHLATRFSAGVQQRLQAHNLKLTAAALQHFFVAQMDSTAEEALEQLDTIVGDVLQNSSSGMLAEATQAALQDSPTPSMDDSNSLASGEEEHKDGGASVSQSKKGGSEKAQASKKQEEKKKRNKEFWAAKKDKAKQKKKAAKAAAEEPAGEEMLQE